MRTFTLVAITVFMLGSPVFGDYIEEDTFYWFRDGTVVVNPNPVPLGAEVKIQQTVYDCDNAQSIIENLLYPNVNGYPLPPVINGPASRNPIPAGTCFDLYAYSITNLAYDKPSGGYGAGGLGNGIAGFSIAITDFAIPYLIWAPNRAFTAWIPDPGFSPRYEWDNPKALGSLGLLESMTAGSFLLAVPSGTPKGFPGALVHTWVTNPDGSVTQADLLFGFVSGPVPEPATIGLMLIGLFAVARRRT